MPENKINRRNYMKYVGAGAVVTAAAVAGGYYLSQQPITSIGKEKIIKVGLPSDAQTMWFWGHQRHDWVSIRHLIFDHEIMYDSDGKLYPMLAKSMPEISNDSKKYTFDLRDDVYFHDSDRWGKYDANDVKYSFDWSINNVGLKENVRGGHWSSLIDKIEVEDTYRVAFHLKVADIYWLTYMGKYSGTVPENSIEEIGSENLNINPVGVGTGPGKFVEFKKGSHATVEKNENYWQKGYPKWDKVIFYEMGSDTARVGALQTKDINIASSIPTSDFDRVKTLPGINTGEKGSKSAWVNLWINGTKPPLDNYWNRKALTYGINREEIKEAYQGHITPFSIPFNHPDGWWYSEQVDKAYSYNPNKVQECLDEAGNPDGFDLDLINFEPPVQFDSKKAALVIQDQLAKVGINASIKIQAPAHIISSMYSEFPPIFEHAVFWALQSAVGPPYFYYSGMHEGQGMWKGSGVPMTDRYFDALLRFMAEPDQTKAKQIWHDMVTYYAEDMMSNITIGSWNILDAWSDNIKDYEVNTAMEPLLHKVDIV